MKMEMVKSDTSSRCTAYVAKHMNRTAERFLVALCDKVLGMS